MNLYVEAEEEGAQKVGATKGQNAETKANWKGTGYHWRQRGDEAWNGIFGT